MYKFKKIIELYFTDSKFSKFFQILMISSTKVVRILNPYYLNKEMAVVIFLSLINLLSFKNQNTQPHPRLCLEGFRQLRNGRISTKVERSPLPL